MGVGAGGRGLDSLGPGVLLRGFKSYTPALLHCIRSFGYMHHSAPQKHASAGNRTRVTSMATMYSTTRPLMLATMPLSKQSAKPAKHNQTMTQARRRHKNAPNTHTDYCKLHLARIELATFSVLG